MNSNNHPLYHSLGNPPNIQLLDTMFGMQSDDASSAASGIPKSTLVPVTQYSYSEVQLSAHHAMNLTPPAHVVTSSDVSNTGQYQGTTENELISNKTLDGSRPHMITVLKKKDIVAEATSKIFEDIGGVVSSHIVPNAVRSEVGKSLSVNYTNQVPKPAFSSSSVVHTSGPVSAGRPRGGVRQIPRQQILPRLQLLEDEDDGLTCRMCLQSFWYKSQLTDHLKSSHSITDPDRYEREEREKKMRHIREEQQRQILAKRQRMAAAQGRGGGTTAHRGGRTTGVGNVGGRLGHPVVPKQSAGPRPSFQYRDGAFICDLCKKSFSDGNDMVTHWKSHVKKQKDDLQEGRVPGRRGRPPKNPASIDGRGGGTKTHLTSRGRPITKKQAGRRGRKPKAKGRSDKGKPRWTSYLVWSSRRRKEISQKEPDWSFAEVAKNISTEWKEVSQEDRDKYQKEANMMNAAGQRKMPRDRDEGSEDSSAEEDPDFEEYNVKPIMLKIKKEKEDDGTSRSARKRKRPSFFQEFENEENNLDKILDEFEQEQIEEAKKPRPEKKITAGTSDSTRRRRKRQQLYEEPEEPVELEKTRSGRVRKKTRLNAYFDSDEDGNKDEENEDEDRDEYQPDESEPEEPDEEFVEEEDQEEESKEVDGDVSNSKKITLPLKKRGRPKKIMTDAEIEEATLRAMSAKPVVLVDQLNADDYDESDSSAGMQHLKRKKEGIVYKVKPTWITKEDDEHYVGISVKNEPSDSNEELPKVGRTLTVKINEDPAAEGNQVKKFLAKKPSLDVEETRAIPFYLTNDNVVATSNMAETPIDVIQLPVAKIADPVNDLTSPVSMEELIERQKTGMLEVTTNKSIQKPGPDVLDALVVNDLITKTAKKVEDDTFKEIF